MSEREIIEQAAQEVRTAVERFAALAKAHPDLARPEVTDMLAAANTLEKAVIRIIPRAA